MKLLEKILGISKDIRAVFWKRGDRFEPMFRQGEMYDVDKVRVAVDGLLDCLSDSDTSNMALRFENDYVHLRQVKDVFMVVVVGGEMSYS
ncbi:MAG: hypothetical protein EOM12_13175, partial [Verrucomicrobiae bacterium]|nr:hypothetical protein [Verrucomicrobiae bacterium]